MSYYSLVCIEMVKEVWPRALSQLKRRDIDLRKPNRIFEGENTVLLVWEWNHAPNACELDEDLYNNLGLDINDYNVTVVEESNGDMLEDGTIVDRAYTAGGLPISYECVDENGRWSVYDEGRSKCTIVYNGKEIVPSYRLSDYEFECQQRRKRDGDTDRCDS